jgi:hypothetical protein
MTAEIDTRSHFRRAGRLAFEFISTRDPMAGLAEALRVCDV